MTSKAYEITQNIVRIYSFHYIMRITRALFCFFFGFLYFLHVLVSMSHVIIVLRLVSPIRSILSTTLQFLYESVSLYNHMHV